MSGFAALMALSASQTKEAQGAVQTALEQRQRNEALKRKKQEELERKIREEDAKLRQKRFEEEKRQLEQEAKRAAEATRRAAEQTRREEEARNLLLYGPKKAKLHQLGGPRWPTSQSGLKEEVRRQRLAGGLDDGDGDDGSAAMALTREEKRQRRVDAEMRRTYQLKRASSSAGYFKAGRRLPGGAIDAPASSSASESGASAKSVKARLAALPNTLTKLNVNKRDTRTIDEILQDRARAKNSTLDGDDAREFNDWFGKSKKKEPASLPATQSSASLGSASSSGANSPNQAGTKPSSPPLSKSQALPPSGKMAPNPSGIRSSSQSRPTLSAKTSLSMTSKLSAGKSPRSRSPAPKSHAVKSGSASVSGGAPMRSSVPPKKRPRSASHSLSPPPPKRRVAESENTLSSEIWKLFGKDRNSYISRDVLSDDEDMEADAGALMKEEIRSSRLAKREDEIALEEEKRHEEEKRRRKRERDIRER